MDGEGEEGRRKNRDAVVTVYKSSLWCGPHGDDQTEIRLIIPLVRTQCTNKHPVHLLLQHWLGVFQLLLD